MPLFPYHVLDNYGINCAILKSSILINPFFNFFNSLMLHQIPDALKSKSAKPSLKVEGFKCQKLAKFRSFIFGTTK